MATVNTTPAREVPFVSLTKRVKDEDRYLEILKVISGVMKDKGLTKTELDLVSYMCARHIVALDTEKRKAICNDFSFTPYDLNNHLMRLRKKKVMVEHELAHVFKRIATEDFSKGIEFKINILVE